MRNRRVLVCINCKQRKTKCDRGSPCSGCVTHGVNCVYMPEPNKSINTDSKINKKKEVENEISVLRHKIENLEKSIGLVSKSEHDEVWKYAKQDFEQRCVGINPCAQNGKFQMHTQGDFLMASGTPLFRFHGPLSWVSLVQSDPALAPNVTYREGEVQRLLSINPTTQRESTTLAEMSDDRLLTGRPQNKPFQERALSLGISRSNANGIAADLSEKIRRLLPTRDIMWALIDRFFLKIYCFFPLVDQWDFEAWVTNVIGNDRSKVVIDKLNVENQMDYASLGMLLIILRLSYLSTFLATAQFADEKVQEMRDNAIPIDVFDVAKQCLHKFNYLRMANFTTLQLALFIKIYYMYAPELGHTPEDSGFQSFTSLLAQMAMSLGMHRDPDYIRKQNLTKREINLRRKTWYYILYLEIQCSLNNGFPLSIRPDEFDTKVPSVEPNNENSKYDFIEKTIPKLFSRFHSLHLSFSEPLTKFASLKKTILTQNLCTTLTSWENEIMLECKLILKPDTPLSLEDCYETVAYLESRILFCTTTFRLYLHWEKINVDLMYYYYKKAILHCVTGMVIFCEDIEKDIDIWFQEVPDLFIIPPLENYLHRGIVILQSMMFRTRFSILAYENSPTPNRTFDSTEKYQLQLTTFELLNNVFDIIMGGFYKLSRRYYYSWRCSVAQNTLQKSRNGTDYYLEWCKDRETYLPFTSAMLQDFNNTLHKILEESNKRKGTPRNMILNADWENSEQAFNDIGDFWVKIVDLPEMLEEDFLANDMYFS